MNTRVFFTSIPKCGKNIIYSLFFGIGYKYHNLIDESYARYAYAANFDGVNYVYAPNAVEHGSFGTFADELARMAPRSVFHRHLLPRPEFTAALVDAGLRPILVVRDPRDALLSAGNYALSGKPAHIVERLGSRDLRSIIIAILEGQNGMAPFAQQFDAYRGWTTDWRTLTVRFEDIIGPAGGGEAKAQLHSITRILEHVDHPAPAASAREGSEHVFNTRAGTFFRGQIGSWRAFADRDLDKRFETHAGHLLERWGYA